MCMKKRLLLIFFLFMFGICFTNSVCAQCSICTKTAGQLGEKKAQSLNSGIVYLMLTPFAIAAFIGYRWWRGEKEFESTQE